MAPRPSRPGAARGTGSPSGQAPDSQGLSCWVALAARQSPADFHRPHHYRSRRGRPSPGQAATRTEPSIASWSSPLRFNGLTEQTPARKSSSNPQPTSQERALQPQRCAASRRIAAARASLTGHVEYVVDNILAPSPQAARSLASWLRRCCSNTSTAASSARKPGRRSRSSSSAGELSVPARVPFK